MLVESLTPSIDERDYTYVTIDGVKAFRFACPICSPDSKKRNGSIFPKRMKDWKGNYPKKCFIYVRVRVIVLVKAFILSITSFQTIFKCKKGTL